MDSGRKETSKPDAPNKSQSKPTISLAAIPLTPQEIESLRQDKKESSARGKKLWAEWLRQQEATKPKVAVATQQKPTSQ